MHQPFRLLGFRPHESSIGAVDQAFWTAAPDAITAQSDRVLVNGSARTPQRLEEWQRTCTISVKEFK